MKYINATLILFNFCSLALHAADSAAQSQRDSALYAQAREAAIEGRIAQSQKDGGTGYKQCQELAKARHSALQSQSAKQSHYSGKSGSKGGGRKR